MVTDSSCDLPDEVVDKHSMILVPLQVIGNNRTMKDRVDPEAKNIYAGMRTGTVYSTSQPTPGDFVHAFTEASAGFGLKLLRPTIAR